MNAQTGNAGRPPKAAEARIGKRILDAALALFSKDGFEAASMDRIAAEARVTKKTLYARYGSKINLFVAAFEHGVDTHLRQISVDTHLPSSRQMLLEISARALEVALKPTVIGLEQMRLWIVRSRLTDTDVVLPVLASGATRLYRSFLIEAGGAQLPLEELEFLANFLLQTLVIGPRNQILISGSLANSSAARLEYLRRAVDLIAPGLPFVLT